MEITHADSDDLERIVDLWIALADGQRAFGSHLLADANRTKIRETVARRIVADRLLVAQSDDITGFVMYRTEAERYEQDRSRGILFVEADGRGTGIGSELLRAAEDKLRENGVHSVALEVMVDNEHARQFYRDHGYEPHRLELEKPLEDAE